jgi:putative membrane protein
VLGIVAIVLVGAFVVLPLLIGPGMMGGWGMGPRMMGGPWWGGSWGWGAGFFLLAGLFKLLLLVGIVMLALSFFKHNGRPWHGPAGWYGTSESPLDILKRRLAKGEITREEYETLKAELL